jgi:tetratricopeptide (TPR) repeat protein
MSTHQSVLYISQLLRTMFGFVNEQNWSMALNACLTLIKKGSREPKVFFYAGLSLWNLGQREEAAKNFQQALGIDPTFKHAARAHHYLGREYRRWATSAADGVNETHILIAATHFRRAISLDQEGSKGVYQNALAGCYALQGEQEKAIASFHEAIDHGYEHPEECRRNIALCLIAQQRYEEAQQRLQPVHSGDSRSALLNAKLQFNSHASAPADVVETLEKAIPRFRQQLDQLAVTPSDQRPSFMITSNQHAILLKGDMRTVIQSELVEALGLAAIFSATRGALDKAEFHIRSIHSLDPHHPLIYLSLQDCRKQGEQGQTLCHRLTEEFKITGSFGRASAHPAGDNNEGGGDLLATALLDSNERSILLCADGEASQDNLKDMSGSDIMSSPCDMSSEGFPSGYSTAFGQFFSDSRSSSAVGS